MPTIPRRWLPLFPLLAGLALPACNVSNYDDDDTTGDDDDDDTTPPIEVIVTAVSPSSGTPAGGYTVNVYGTNFTTVDDTEVYFDEERAALVGCGPNQCTVTVPPADDTGAVDVTVINPNGEGTLEDGFEYAQDITNFTNYFAHLTRLDYAYPDIYSTPPVSNTSSHAYFFEPMSLDVLREIYWGGALPTMGNCVTFSWDDAPSVNVDAWDAGDAVTFDGPTEYELEHYFHYYRLENLAPDDYIEGTYDLVIQGGDDMGGEHIANALVAPPTFTTDPDFAPAQMTAGTFAAGFDVTVMGTCSGAVLAFDVYYTGDPYLEYESTVLCHYPGAGQWNVPAALTSQFPSVVGVITRIECYEETTTTVQSGARMTTVGRHAISGVILM